MLSKKFHLIPPPRAPQSSTPKGNDIIGQYILVKENANDDKIFGTFYNIYSFSNFLYIVFMLIVFATF